ncbi:MAG: hypothetical protein VKP63_04080 [Cyanobacteriota bacterium]|nr:hypothetical protein [Cyanobacteriota bacterium]
MALAPFLLAASPTPAPTGEMFFPFTPPSVAPDVRPAQGVESYDPVGRAQLIADSIPRTWRGTYRPFGGGASVPAVLQLRQVTPLGQMVDLRGELNVAGRTSPVQGNINAKSNQLDLLVLGTNLSALLEPGGEFQGQQGLSLSGWLPDRLTTPGGRLQLNPGPAPAPAPGSGGVVRGLW